MKGLGKCYTLPASIMIKPNKTCNLNTPLRYPPKEKPKNPFWRPSNPVSACIGLLKKTIGKIFAKQNFEKIMIFKVVVVLLLDTLKLCLFKAISHT